MHNKSIFFHDTTWGEERLNLCDFSPCNSNRKTVETQIDYGSRATLKHKGHNKIDFEMLINISDIVHTITEIQHLFSKE